MFSDIQGTSITAAFFLMLMPAQAQSSSNAVVPTAAAAEPSTKSLIDPTQLEAWVDELVQSSMHEDGIAGVGVAIVDASGSLLLKGYGTAGRGRAVDANTLFQVQSISKTFVWIALMQLVEEGKIRLDDPINLHLPAFLQIPDEGFRNPILVRDLMNHTAGFEDSAFGHLFVQRPEQLMPLNTYLAHYRVHRVREPDTLQVYSNYGGALGGALVAHVSGTGWEDYVEQRIIRPLGMGTATFRQPYSEELARARGLPSPMPPATAALLTEGFRRGPSGLEAASREFTADFPAGALVASAKDMAAYMSALLDPKAMARAHVLPEQTLVAMRIPMFRGAAGFGDMRSGFQSFPLPGDIEAFGHGGDSVYQVASMTLIPSLGLGIFVSANTESARGLTVGLRQHLVSKYMSPERAQPRYAARAYEEASSYAGEYRSLRRPYFRTEHGIYDLLIDVASVTAQPNGDLLVRSFLGDPRLLLPLGGGIYRDNNQPDRVAFRPLNGKIAMYEPYNFTAWERVPAWESTRVVMGVVALTVTLATLHIAAAIYRRREPRQAKGFDRYAVRMTTAAAVAWASGFLLLSGFLAKGLTAANVREIIWWYPPITLIYACWTFAVAAALSLALIPTLAVVVRSKGWSGWRKGLQAFEVLIFAACTAAFWKLGFLGFSGW